MKLPASAAQPRIAEFVGLLALITSLTALSIDALLPALGAIGRSLGVQDPGNLQLVVSLFIGGMVLGELVFGPVSDAVGRRRTIMAGLVIYIAGTLLARRLSRG